MSDRFTERFTFTQDDDTQYRLRCVGCKKPVDEWDADQAPIMLSPRGQLHLREVAAAHDRAKHPRDVPAVPTITPGEMLPPAAWCVRYGLRLFSRDGWRDKPWTEPVGLPEFARRAKRCTQDLEAWQAFVDTVPKGER